ncbi:accessory factor UbiK family protein [Aureimonas frigidaquae]|uniref:accessory factor UbiK family protein n=1 Tax=Aureimonas frigidaquae TaxID=424757 RepID=UPI000782043F|nr:accessory factor UbiK family protein [Aureimonas frigidaquae]
MTTRGPNRILDEFSKVFTDTAGAAQGVRREVETVVRSQVERLINQLELVQREEFEAVRDMAVRARTENEELKRRIAALEVQLGRTDPAAPGDADTPSPAAPTL